jgi:hypothetical protein
MDTQTGSVLMMVVALVISAGNLMVSFGRSQVQKQDVDTQALAVAVKLAERTPELERQLRETIAHLHDARAEVELNRQKIVALNYTIQEQAGELGRMRDNNRQLQLDLSQLQAVVNTLKPPGEVSVST